MKRMILAGVAALMVSGPAMAADPVLGMYKTQPGDNGNYGHVELIECGAAICGVIRKAFNGAGKEIASDNIGKRMIWDMQARGGGSYAKGKIWAPDRDKTYRSKMKLSGRTLKVSGCVLGICRSQSWTKIK